MSIARITQIGRNVLNEGPRIEVRITQIGRQVLHGYTCITPGVASFDSCPETLMEDVQPKAVTHPLDSQGDGVVGQPALTPNPDVQTAPGKAVPPFLGQSTVDRRSASSSSAPSFLGSDRPRPIK